MAFQYAGGDENSRPHSAARVGSQPDLTDVLRAASPRGPEGSVGGIEHRAPGSIAGDIPAAQLSAGMPSEGGLL